MTTNAKDEEYFTPKKWKRPDIIPFMNGERFYFDDKGMKVVVDEEEYQQSLKDKGLA